MEGCLTTSLTCRTHPKQTRSCTSKLFVELLGPAELSPFSPCILWPSSLLTCLFCRSPYSCESHSIFSDSLFSEVLNFRSSSFNGTTFQQLNESMDIFLNKNPSLISIPSRTSKTFPVSRSVLVWIRGRNSLHVQSNWYLNYNSTLKRMKWSIWWVDYSSSLELINRAAGIDVFLAVIPPPYNASS